VRNGHGWCCPQADHEADIQGMTHVAIQPGGFERELCVGLAAKIQPHLAQATGERNMIKRVTNDNDYDLSPTPLIPLIKNRLCVE